MGQVIDFRTRMPIGLPVKDRPAKLEIISWRDPMARGIAKVKGRVLVDGILPEELAVKFQAMCEEWNVVA